ncbi:MAG TPA: hypothetical protein VGP48_10260 [Stellaceae bacterium]|jgi:hypothetical protein|nr:hypothetical protein [Stellaceae bacterium]
MPSRDRLSTKRPRALRPEHLTEEAKTWRHAAKQARDPFAKQEFEEMAATRETVARAIAELDTNPAEDKPESSKP